jgi:hypothetical protein
MALRNIFGLRREEVTEGQRKFHNEDLNYLHSSRDIVEWSYQRG